MKSKILIYKEDEVSVNLPEIVGFLNKKNEDFELIIGERHFELPDKIVSVSETYKKIDQQILNECEDKLECIFLTLKPYDDLYFSGTHENITIISFSGWNSYTNLPLNNGLVYFLYSGLADLLDEGEDSCQHTGCIFNFLGEKSNIDAGMRNAHIHPDCENEKILPNLKNNDNKRLHKELKNLLYELSIASNKDMDILNYWKLIDNEVNNCEIDKISIQNFYSVKSKIELDGLNDKKFIFLLGENGSGKTIFLKALLIALKKYQIEIEASKEITGIISDILSDNKSFSYYISAKSKTKFYEFNEITEAYIKNIYAYGTNRNKLSSDKADKYGFMTLFKDDEFLINPEQWLKDIKLLEYEAKEDKSKQTITVLEIQNILSELLEIDNLKIEVITNKVSFLISGTKFSLNELSEGYQSSISFILDLIARMIANNKTWTKINDFKGIVLIDELDLFLHPTWEKNICFKLHKWFPDIQFFITTHSPILIDGAVKKYELAEKIIVFRFSNENNITKLSEKYQGKDINTWLPNILISSNLFDPEYIDKIPKDLILKARTENSFGSMLITDENIKKLREKEEVIKQQYQEFLKKNKND